MRKSNGTFAPGHPGYKPKGSLNNVTRERKEKLMGVIQAIENDHLEADLKALKADERVRIWLQCHEYVIPKLARTEASIEIPDSIEQLMSMTPEERRERIARIRELMAERQSNGYEEDEEDIEDAECRQDED